MTILALDLGTRTGWAALAPGGVITSGVQSFAPGKHDGGGMRFLRFRRWLAEVDAAVGGITQVHYEAVARHTGTDAAHVYGGLLAHLTAWCEDHGIPYAGHGVGTIKRHATGKGNANKHDMIRAAQARGYRPADDNEADALALLHMIIEAGA